MDTKTENGKVIQRIPNTNLIQVVEGGIETLICTSEEGITEQALLTYFAWLDEQPDRIYKGPRTPDDDPLLVEDTRRAREFLKAHPLPREFYDHE